MAAARGSTAHRRPAVTRARRGFVSVAAAMLAVAVAGLSLALVLEGRSSKQAHTRLDTSLRALEAAETGIARAEEEIASQVDSGTDGVGNLSGAFAGSSFQVTATQDPLASDRWILRAVGTCGLSRRVIEAGCQRLGGGVWAYAMFAKQTITMSGGLSTTDSYDSRLGTYASQATHADGDGPYAGTQGSIGTNAGSVSISGGGTVRGDATAGPSYSTSLSGGSTVTGSVTALDVQLDLSPTPLTTMQAASALNDDGLWSATGGLTWNAFTKSLTVSGGNTITLTGSNYFFTSLTLSGGSTLKITGPVKMYVTGNVDFSGGTIANATGAAVNFQLYAYPYAVPTTFSPPASPTVKLSGGSQSAYAVYAPAAAITISGGAGVYGSVIGKTITPSGGSHLHYDEALGDALGGARRVHRTYWLDVAPPAR